MKKKMLMLFMSVCMMFMLTGCSLAEITLTDDENEEIAEYAAHLLLKYDRNYSPTLMYRDEFDEARQALSATPTPTPEPVLTDAPQTTGSPQQDGSNVTSTPGVTPSVEYTLDDITGFKRFKLEYTGHSFVQSYTTESEYFSIDAPAGSKILVCNFLFTNSNDRARALQTIDLELSYRLHISDNATLDARISLLDNDIQYLDTELEAGGTYEAVVLFFVNDSLQNEQMLLSVSNGERTAEIKIQ